MSHDTHCSQRSDSCAAYCKLCRWSQHQKLGRSCMLVYMPPLRWPWCNLINITCQCSVMPVFTGAEAAVGASAVHISCMSAAQQWSRTQSRHPPRGGHTATVSGVIFCLSLSWGRRSPVAGGLAGNCHCVPGCRQLQQLGLSAATAADASTRSPRQCQEVMARAGGRL